MDGRGEGKNDDMGGGFSDFPENGPQAPFQAVAVHCCPEGSPDDNNGTLIILSTNANPKVLAFQPARGHLHLRHKGASDRDDDDEQALPARQGCACAGENHGYCVFCDYQVDRSFSQKISLSSFTKHRH